MAKIAGFLSTLILTSCVVLFFVSLYHHQKYGALLYMGVILLYGGIYLVRKKYYSYENCVGGREIGEDVKKNTVMEDGLSSVAGLEEVKREMKEISDFLLFPEKYRQFGAKIPKGVLFYGPPGTGKTLLARALANETHSNFIYASGSEFIEKFVGVGATRIRSLFDKAKKRMPCIVFIDEIDAIGVHRNADNNSERDQTLNQLLIELDGFNQNEGVVIIGATNRIDILDRALLRPGRFDRQIFIGNPPLRAREKILKKHFSDKPLSQKVDIRKLALKTNGLSGAHLANIANEAAILAIRHHKREIGEEEVDDALIKTTAGLKNMNAVLSLEERKIVSFHESAHALAECHYKDTVPECITIVPHGQSLGFMLGTGSEEKFLMSEDDMKNSICVLLAGRAAEELLFHKITTGSQNDLERANEIAYEMVCSYGMNEEKNRVYIKKLDTFLNDKVNERITKILDGCYESVMQLLKKEEATLERLARMLNEKEVLRQKDIEGILGHMPV